MPKKKRLGAPTKSIGEKKVNARGYTYEQAEWLQDEATKRNESTGGSHTATSIMREAIDWYRKALEQAREGGPTSEFFTPSVMLDVEQTNHKNKEN